jgi:ATP/maltotriose-dependent transcriptional regulator MalT
MTYSLFHKYDSALIYHQKAIDQMPDWAGSYKNRFEALILKNGITREAREIIDEAIRRTGDNMKRYRVLLSMYDGKYDYAFQLAENARNDEFDFEGEKYLLMAKLSSTLGNSQEASRYYESVRVILSQALKKSPKEGKLHASIGLAYAGLGNKTLAIEEAEKSIQLTNPQNKMDETDMKVNIAQIYTLLGDYDNAFATVSYLLNNPSFFSKELLMIDPVWKPLIDKPEYKRKIREIPG